MPDWIREPNEYERGAASRVPPRPAQVAPPQNAHRSAPVRSRPRPKRRGRRFRRAMGWFLVLAVLLGVLAALIFYRSAYSPLTAAERQIKTYALFHGHSPEDYPPELVELLERNPETKDFVLAYPDERDRTHEISLLPDGMVPLYLQWDKRWGYESYNGKFLALTGCGPCCLAMAASYLTGDASYDPLWMARWSEEQGYAVAGEGTAWALFSEGAEKLGLDAVEISADEQRVADNLAVGNVIVCVMGPGDFTTEGHFILLTDYSDGFVSVRDPNSIERSERSWRFADISGQMLALWVLRT